MELRRKSRLTSEVSTSALNDIMFFLMLFFLIMSTIVTPSVIKLNLPKSTPGQTVSKQSITIAIDAQSNYFLNDKPIPYEQIQGELASITVGAEDPTVILRCDNTLPVQKIVDLISIGNDLKVKMVLATEQKK